MRHRASIGPLVLAFIVSLAGCAASSPTEARAGASRRQVLVAVDVFERWPAHPALQFDLAQTQHRDGVEPPAPPPSRMDPDVYAAFLAAVAARPEARTIGQPRLMLADGEAGRLDVGEDGGAGYGIDVVPRIGDDGVVRLDLTYRAVGLPVDPPASEFEDGDVITFRTTALVMEPSWTEFGLATGFIGAPLHLIAVRADLVP